MRAATEQELKNYTLVREREDLERLLEVLDSLQSLTLEMQHRKTCFVIQDRLEERLGDVLAEYLDDTLSPIRRETENRISELKV